MTLYKTILTDVSDSLMTLTLNRPERMNAFNSTMMQEMIAAFDNADQRDDVRAVIVTGGGERAFCAGADLGSGGATFDYASNQENVSTSAPVRSDGTIDFSHLATRDSGGRLALRIFNARKPVIGAINGAAVGIGATMLLPMDIRVASHTARFGFVFTRRGIVPEAASSWFLPRLVGISQALEWSMSGKVFDANEALRGGLVRSLHDSTDLLPAARRLAHELTDNAAPVSVALTRQMMWRMLGAGHPMDAHRLDSRLVWQRGTSADAQEGIAAFLEKREAAYSNTVSRDMPQPVDWLEDPEYATSHQKPL